MSYLLAGWKEFLWDSKLQDLVILPSRKASDTNSYNIMLHFIICTS